MLIWDQRRMSWRMSYGQIGFSARLVISLAGRTLAEAAKAITTRSCPVALEIAQQCYHETGEGAAAVTLHLTAELFRSLDSKITLIDLNVNDVVIQYEKRAVQFATPRLEACSPNETGLRG